MTSSMQRAVAKLALALAALALVTFAPSGASAKVGATCGGFIGPILCGKGEFCQHAPGYCFPFLPGTCAKVPQICLQIFRPVCGCDGKTYSNDCVRMRARVSKRHDGRCT